MVIEFIRFSCFGKVYEIGMLGKYDFEGWTTERILAFKKQFVESYKLFKGINGPIDWIL